MNPFHCAVITIIFFVSPSLALFSRLQSTAVKGILTCDGEPARNVKLQLWDINRFVSNDLMAEGATDAQGKFLIQGTEKGFTTIDPELRIFHKCSNTLGRCYKKVSLEIPKEYVSQGKTPTKIFDVANIELKKLISQDTRDCS